jgi:hypothetical protein
MRSRLRSLGAAWLLASAAVVAMPRVASAEEAGAAAIARLLEVGWDGSPAARKAADQQTFEVARLVGRDPRALTASWLVLIQQRRYEEAVQRLDTLLAIVPDDLQALRAKAWCHTLLKNYEGAMLTASTLSELLADKPAETADAAAGHAELIGFLGRLLGFLAGPAADAVNQDARKSLEREIAGRLDESQKAIFEDARNGVLSKFIETTDATVEERERVAEEAAADKVKTLEEIAAEREEALARQTVLEERKNKLQGELRDELAEVQKEDQPLVQELSALQARSEILSRDLLSYLGQVDRFERQAAASRDPNQQRRLYAEADRWDAAASRADADLQAVRQFAQGVQGQRAVLARRAAQAQANAASQIKRIDSELVEMAKREKRNAGIEKRLNRQAVGPTSRGRALSAAATALSTYDQLPLEEAKAKLLETLR